MNSKNGLKMIVGMATCCLVPALVLLIVSSLGIASGNKIVSAIVPFLCPIMMVGMMIFMGMGKKGHNHGGHSCCHGDTEENSEVKKIVQ